MCRCCTGEDRAWARLVCHPHGAGPGRASPEPSCTTCPVPASDTTRTWCREGCRQWYREWSRLSESAAEPGGRVCCRWRGVTRGLSPSTSAVGVSRCDATKRAAEDAALAAALAALLKGLVAAEHGPDEGGGRGDQRGRRDTRRGLDPRGEAPDVRAQADRQCGSTESKSKHTMAQRSQRSSGDRNDCRSQGTCARTCMICTLA